MNLKDILNPVACIMCRFIKVVNHYGGTACQFGCWSIEKYKGYYDGFDPTEMVHKDCPLPRIKCENCKHSKQWPDGCYYCTKEGADCLSVACIEFEEVK